MLRIFTKTIILLFFFSTLSTGFGAIPPEPCACGCTVFSVGNRWMMTSSTGYKLSLSYSFMDQNTNWSSASSARPELNSDKNLRTDFYTIGFQYMASREWGAIVEMPVWNRYFSTVTEDGVLISAQHSSTGDIRVMGKYSGLSEDMSEALLFGLKLPSGAINQTVFDRDTQIGSGTLDAIAGAYKVFQQGSWGWNVQGLFQYALNTRDEYRPGNTLDLSAGLHYDGFAESFSLVPMVQIVASFRGHDSGVNSNPGDSGYQRVFIAPGFEATISQTIQIFADVRIPVITKVTGFQLVAPSLLNMTASLSL